MHFYVPLTHISIGCSVMVAEECRTSFQQGRFILTKRKYQSIKYLKSKQHFVSFKKHFPIGIYLNILRHTSTTVAFQQIQLYVNWKRKCVRSQVSYIDSTRIIIKKNSTGSILIKHKLVEQCRYRLPSMCDIPETLTTPSDVDDIGTDYTKPLLKS
jgi:hypothetical protein